MCQLSALTHKDLTWPTPWTIKQVHDKELVTISLKKIFHLFVFNVFVSLLFSSPVRTKKALYASRTYPNSHLLPGAVTDITTDVFENDGAYEALVLCVKI